jgi:Fe-S-cluster containining protein
MSDQARQSGGGDLAPSIALWRRAIEDGAIVSELEGIYAQVGAEIEARGPACWASGRCCNFEKVGHRLYTTGLEAAYTLRMTSLGRNLTRERVDGALTRGGCPFQEKNLCGVHPGRPLGCRVFFCDRSAQVWQHELSERGLGLIRGLHDRHGVPYLYAEWRYLLGEMVGERAGEAAG